MGFLTAGSRTRHAGAAAVLAALAASCTMTANNLLEGALAPETVDARRDTDEKACMARRAARPSATIVVLPPIDEGDGCGMASPLEVTAFVGGSIAVAPTAKLGCPLVEALEEWMTVSVQPAARAHFNSTVTGIRQLSNYACRKPMGYRPGQMSEHSYGNALDISEFRLANGRVVAIQGGWNGAADEQAFLREIAVTGCQYFRTFLGPGVIFHGNHYHVDLAYRGESGTDRYCRPLPQMTIPPERTPKGGIWVAADPKRRGRLLTEMPADVAASLENPFGAGTGAPKTTPQQTSTGTPN